MSEAPNIYNTFNDNNIFNTNSTNVNKEDDKKETDDHLFSHLNQNEEKEEKNYNTLDFNMNPFNQDEKSISSKSNSDEEFMFVESDIKNNFVPEGVDLSDNNIDSTNENEPTSFNDMKKELDINKRLPPKVPSYPVPMSSLGNSYGINRNQTLGGLNNSFTNNNLFNGFGFPSNSFTMNGKSGWICPSCKNFNYESKFYIYNILVRTQCNRCGRGMYKSPSIQSANGLSNTNSNNFITNISPLPYVNSQLNLSNNNLMSNEFKGGYLSPPNKYSHSHSPKPKKGDNEKKKKKPFVEREGDWICFKCKNLNFAFRTNCNRCHLTKNENQKIIQQYMSNYSGFKVGEGQ